MHVPSNYCAALHPCPVFTRKRTLFSTQLGEDKRLVVCGHLDRLAQAESRGFAQALKIGKFAQAPWSVARLQRRIERGVRGCVMHTIAHERPVQEEKPANAQQTAGAGEQSQARRPWRDVNHVE